MTDPNIAPDLPDKTEIGADCGLSKKQVALYQHVLDDLQQRLENSDGMARRGLGLASLTQLKQICNHRSLYLRQDEFASRDSGKFQRLTQIGEAIADRQQRLLIFTQFQAMP